MHLRRQALGVLVASVCQQLQLALVTNRLPVLLQVWCNAKAAEQLHGRCQAACAVFMCRQAAEQGRCHMLANLRRQAMGVRRH